MHAFLTNLVDEATAGDARPSVDQALVEVFGFGCSVGTIGTSVPGVSSRCAKFTTWRPAVCSRSNFSHCRWKDWHDPHRWCSQTSKPTVVVAAGQVAAGFTGIQLAKFLGAEL